MTLTSSAELHGCERGPAPSPAAAVHVCWHLVAGPRQGLTVDDLSEPLLALGRDGDDGDVCVSLPRSLWASAGEQSDADRRPLIAGPEESAFVGEDCRQNVADGRQ